MTNDLISREKVEEVIEALVHEPGVTDDAATLGCMVWKAVSTMKAVDAAPVVHAYWYDSDGKAWCSACDNSNKAYKPPFCPHCGAKMDKETGNAQE